MTCSCDYSVQMLETLSVVVDLVTKKGMTNREWLLRKTWNYGEGVVEFKDACAIIDGVLEEVKQKTEFDTQKTLLDEIISEIEIYRSNPYVKMSYNPYDDFDVSASVAAKFPDVDIDIIEFLVTEVLDV